MIDISKIKSAATIDGSYTRRWIQSNQFTWLCSLSFIVRLLFNTLLAKCHCSIERHCLSPSSLFIDNSTIGELILTIVVFDKVCGSKGWERLAYLVSLTFSQRREIQSLSGKFRGFLLYSCYGRTYHMFWHALNKLCIYNRYCIIAYKFWMCLIITSEYSVKNTLS